MKGMRVWVAVTALALAGGFAAGLTLATVMQTQSPGQSHATPDPAQRAPQTPRASPAERSHVTLGQAVKMVEARYRGRVVRATTQGRGPQTIYVMRLLDRHGRVFTVRVEAASGRIL